MIKEIAWKTFKNTGNIDTFLELKQLENIESKNVDNKLKKVETNGYCKNERNNYCRK